MNSEGLTFGIYPLSAAGTPFGLTVCPEDNYEKIKLALKDLKSGSKKLLPRNCLIYTKEWEEKMLLNADHYLDAGLIGDLTIGLGLQLLFPIDIPSEMVFKVGIVFFIIGAIVAAWGLIIFHKVRTTTVPGEISATLVTTGPYRFTRNPMYVGLTLAYLGEWGILIQIWPIIVLPLLFAYLNWMVIPIEEVCLKETFGNKYEQYCFKVRRWI